MTDYIDLPSWRVRAPGRCWKLRRVTVCQSGANKGRELVKFEGDFTTRDALCRYMAKQMERVCVAMERKRRAA